jgi:hypothetical protein
MLRKEEEKGGIYMMYTVEGNYSREEEEEEEEEMLQIAQTQSITKTQKMLNLSDQGSSYPWP